MHAQIEALRPIDVGILSERRAVRPFGLRGGGSGAPGTNLVLRTNGRVINIGALARCLPGFVVWGLLVSGNPNATL
eukprot:360341-Chlamydomonas_euryale.AAC.8